MNNNQISQLKRTLKKFGIKNAETIVRNGIDFNYNRFLELAEPIYVISRIQSCYVNERELSLLTQANEEWIGIVVDNGWCPPLLPYIEKYGAEVTTKAIQYLIEQKMWDAYEGKTALKVKTDKHYKGFEDIHAAAEYVKDFIPEVEKEEEKPESTPLIEFSDGPEEEKKEDQPIDQTSEVFVEGVFNAITELQETLKDSSTKLNGVLNYVIATSDQAKAAETINQLLKKINELEARKKEILEESWGLDQEIAKLKAENDTLKTQNKEYVANDQRVSQ